MNLIISEKDIVYLNLNNNALIDYYYSKLCFINGFVGLGENAVVINIKDGNFWCYEKEREEFLFPSDISEYQRCFLLRVVIDLIQLGRGNLPLHVAAISDGKKTFIIAANSGKGKSYISDAICKMFPRYYTIGDDHVIISHNHIQGNIKRRIRDNVEEKEKYMDNRGLDQIHEMTFICFDFSETNNCIVALSKSDSFLYYSSVSAFKYLNESFCHNNISYDIEKIAEIDIHNEYQRIFDDIVGKSEVLYVRGTPQYAIECISNKITNNLFRKS